MIIEETNHSENIRLKPREHSVTKHEQPRLRLSRLLKLLQNGNDQDHSAGKGKGRKRSLTERSDEGPRKRAKLSDHAFYANVVDEKCEDEQLVHMYRRVLHIRYTTKHDEYQTFYFDDDAVEQCGWARDEEQLREWLSLHAPAGSDPFVVDLGTSLVRTDGYVCDPSDDTEVLLALPEAGYHPFRYEDYDLRSYGVSDPLQAFRVLAWDDRARLRAHISLLVVPKTASVQEPELPFTLRVQVDCSYVCPKIFEHISDDKSRPDHAKASALQDAQRRLLLFTFPSQEPLPEGYRGATDIPLLFSILTPAPPVASTQAHDTIQPEHLLPTLLPFQRRSVAWMLGREGKAVNASGAVVPKSDVVVHTHPLPLFWEEFQVSPEVKLYVNRLRGIVTPTRPVPEDDELNEDAFGGIVAEEPGLGKTLECISTILLNPADDRSPSNMRWNPETKIEVKEIKTTLIVTPPSLAPQWADELAIHAPTLKVLVYEGWQKVKVPITQHDVALEHEKRLKQMAKGKGTAPLARAHKRKGVPKGDEMDVDEVEGGENEDNEVQDWCAYVNTFDVCITTYSVLQQDLGVARPPPKRPRRAFVDYGDTSRARSPLVMCEWYRVIMDEVQMVGGGKAEEMVSLIPRLSSFAVSGTPARSQVSDLIHILKFLRVKAITESPRTWTRLLLPGYVHEFVELFRRYTVRTMKEAVKSELTIPPQTRYLVPIELGPVQRHVYDQQLDAALLDLGLDARGVAATENWEVDVWKLRSWLRKLRGICTHPQVGQLAAHGADKLHKPGVLKTMTEVLEGMRDQNWRNYMDDRKLKVSNMASLAQLLQQDETNRNRYREALDVLLNAEKDAEKLVADLSDVLAEHAKEGEKLKEETARLREARGHARGPHNNSDDTGKGKGRARSNTPEYENLDADDEGLPRNTVGEAHRGKSTALLGRMREARIALHKVKFLQGDVYHVLGEQYGNQENEAYASAEELRRALLKGTEEAAERAMTYLDRDPVVKALSEKDLFVDLPYLDKGGIKSHLLMDEGNELIEGLLNKQSKLLWQWRMKLIALLTQPLGTQDQDADGQEYTRSLDTQGEAETYLQAYAALLADRRETLTAERTLLAAHDVREVKARKTKAARGTRYGELEEAQTLDLDKLEDHDVQPEHQVMLKTLNDERKALLDDFDPGRAVKSIMVELNNVAIGIMKEEDPERIIAKNAVAKLRSLIANQGKLIDRLYADLAHFRKAFNERISYFRQLQEISDTVAEAEWEGSVKDAIIGSREQQSSLETNINTARARQRYLENLSKSHDEGTLDEDDKTCILCKCDFVRGYITQCAHVYCEDCMKAWLARAGGKACPVCRVSINVFQLQRFVVEEQSSDTPQPPAKILSNGEVVPRSRRETHYNSINPQILEDIKAMEAYGSYGSKIETLVRHLLYIDVTDPGAKSIVFSAWADSLLIIQHALHANGISCLRIDQNTGKQNAAKKFRTDPSISVLLLHGERENAGLNVTCASRVFLVESVVHHAFEVQAIARIDRMGQTKPTEVYCYYAEDTVERNILDLAAKQGLSLYTRDKAAGMLNPTPFTVYADKKQVDAPAKKAQKGDFVYKVDDMLAILFPHMYEDVEYLVPPEESVHHEAQGVQESSSAEIRRTVVAPVQENAVAGPSRSRR
ncbi:SNF2 family N-terminal domain-containing protein [Trametes meyenii]|nr:SNF2 family N-terminal domain-containing protein [Trametes meyenii]